VFRASANANFPGKWYKKTKTKTSRSEPGGRYEPVDLRPYVGMWVFFNASKNDFETYCGEHAGSLEERLVEEQQENSAALSEYELVITLVRTEEIEYIDECLPLDAVTPFMPTSSFSSYSTFSSIEGNLFNYFVTSIGPSCSLSPSQNPYLAYLTPMSFQFPALRDALIAVSANQLRLLNDKRFEREAWSYKNKAIRAVQRAIDAEEIDLWIVATVLMLCFYDVGNAH
jgi:hypothetical protein